MGGYRNRATTIIFLLRKFQVILTCCRRYYVQRFIDRCIFSNGLKVSSYIQWEYRHFFFLKIHVMPKLPDRIQKFTEAQIFIRSFWQMLYRIVVSETSQLALMDADTKHAHHYWISDG